MQSPALIFRNPLLVSLLIFLVAGELIMDLSFSPPLLFMLQDTFFIFWDVMVMNGLQLRQWLLWLQISPVSLRLVGQQRAAVSQGHQTKTFSATITYQHFFITLHNRKIFVFCIFVSDFLLRPVLKLLYLLNCRFVPSINVATTGQQLKLTVLRALISSPTNCIGIFLPTPSVGAITLRRISCLCVWIQID